MIITCENCNKKFDLNSTLIPKKGRMLQCGKCDHKWFFKNEKVYNNNEPLINKEDETELKDLDIAAAIDETKKEYTVKNFPEGELKNDDIIEKDHKKEHKSLKILNYIIVFLISFIALIILADTFKNPLSKFVPNIEVLLYNLIETTKDIILFIKDLI
jgi:predicted Zn finger-like uncharacterized protein